jgi:ABC-type branched-subunit amino acid transport system substrate-binding protein
MKTPALWLTGSALVAALFVAALFVAALFVASCSNSHFSSRNTGSGDPGVTSSSITVGAIANISGPLSSDFAPLVNGVEAYFSMVNAAGGVDGRRLVLGYRRDDQGSATTDLTVAQQLIEQDHVFAIVGVGTPFFGGASYLAHLGVPTFGYMVSSDWSDGPSLYGGYGSYLDFSTAVMGYAYVAKGLHVASVGVVAYPVPQSASACRAAVTGFKSFGVPVGFEDVAFGFGADPVADVLQMKAHHVDFVLTCLDLTGNVAFARAIAQNGLSVHQLWLDGYDRGTVQQYGSLMNGVIFSLEHVPFEAATSFPGKYPGMETYIQQMQRYQPGYAYNEIALDGWISAAQFVAGLRAVGRHLSQAKLVAAINRTSDFTADGIIPPQDWTRGHTGPGLGPFCGTYVEIVNGRFVPRFVQPGNQVFVCFHEGRDIPVPLAPVTPGT